MVAAAPAGRPRCPARVGHARAGARGLAALRRRRRGGVVRRHRLERDQRDSALGRAAQLPRPVRQRDRTERAVAHARARRGLRDRRQRDRPGARARTAPHCSLPEPPACDLFRAGHSQPARDGVHLALHLRLQRAAERIPPLGRAGFLAASLAGRSRRRPVGGRRGVRLAERRPRHVVLPRRAAEHPGGARRSGGDRRRVDVPAAALRDFAAAGAGDDDQRRLRDDPGLPHLRHRGRPDERGSRERHGDADDTTLQPGFRGESLRLRRGVRARARRAHCDGLHRPDLSAARSRGAPLMGLFRYTTKTFDRELLLLAIAALWWIPFYFLVIVSLKPDNELFAQSPGSLPKSLEWGNYSTAWNGSAGFSLGDALKNSLVITIGSVIALVAIGSITAYAVARYRGKLGTVLYFTFVLGIIVPFQLGLIPTYVVLRHLHLTTSYFGMILLYTGILMPLSVFLFTGFVRTLPR